MLWGQVSSSTIKIQQPDGCDVQLKPAKSTFELTQASGILQRCERSQSPSVSLQDEMVTTWPRPHGWMPAEQHVLCLLQVTLWDRQHATCDGHLCTRRVLQARLP